MLDYKAISKAANMERVAAFLGVELDSRHNALCPFHSDSKPSLHLYNDGYYCFVCGAHGDAIDMIQHVRKCTKYEAAEMAARISGNELCRLGPDSSQGISERERREQRYEQWLDRYLTIEAELDKIKDICRISTPFSDVWCYYMHRQDCLLYEQALLDMKMLKENFRRHDERQQRKQRSPTR